MGQSRLEPLFRKTFALHGGRHRIDLAERRARFGITGGFRDARRDQAWTSDTLVLVTGRLPKELAAPNTSRCSKTKSSFQVVEFWPEFDKTAKATSTISSSDVTAAAYAPSMNQSTFLIISVIAAGTSGRRYGNPAPPAATTPERLIFDDELHRRITGVSISTYWRKTFGEPPGWIYGLTA
jgi:hypothetical protein